MSTLDTLNNILREAEAMKHKSNNVEERNFWLGIMHATVFACSCIRKEATA